MATVLMPQTTASEHILIVEDDVSLVPWIADFLIDNGYQVSVADRGGLAIVIVEEDVPDLVILDINLPGADGFEVCRAIRKFYAHPVIMLTARGEEHDDVLGLEVGASDYLVKPVRPKALLSRLRTIPGSNVVPMRCLTFGELRIDADHRSVRFAGRTLPLSSNEFDLLWLMASHAGETMSREDIITQLRGIEYDGFDRSIDILVSRVRKKLGDNDAQHVQIIRRLTKLSVAAREFGAGQFDRRVSSEGISYIADIETEFNRMAERIQTLISDNKLMSSAVSHDLRTPLARLRFGIDVLADTCDPSAREKYIRRLSADISEMKNCLVPCLILRSLIIDRLTTRKRFFLSIRS